MSLPQLTGHKYKYVGSLDIVDTDEKYIKELEKQVEGYLDYWHITANEWKNILWPEIIKLRGENRELRVELALLKKAIKKAQRLTNQKLS
tara:strand:+ start:981 stop:1250 length:270 start_codon:yes stop_codon:yes gene_type:complete